METTMRAQPVMPALFLAVALLLAPSPAGACTNYIVSAGASADGSVFISYSADSHELYGELEFIPGGVHQPGEIIEITDWDTRKYLGRIPQAPRTYTVVGLMNERQVAIGETTYTGREELQDPNGIIDYGSLMQLALQRSRTAREAIEIMGALVAEHGYASTGESMSVSDPKEAWLFEIIGKGPDNKGAVWVARKVPDGYVTAHANQARIRQFPLNDPENCLYSTDVISFARDKGWYEGPDEEFSFADTYAPPSFGGVRFCEARVWSFFNRVAPSRKIPIALVKGIEGAEPLPLWIKPDRKLSARDVMDLMRDHFEGTEFDLSKGVGAGPYGCPYRWRPLTWEVDGKKYVNDRAVSTQQTGFSFVAQSRSWLPDTIGGVFWFGVDDTASTVYLPFYSSMREPPYNFAVGTGDFETFTWDSAFWVFNVVSNFAYSRYRDMIVDIQAVQQGLEGSFEDRQPEVEKAALKLYEEAPELARDYLTAYSHRQAELTVQRWSRLFEELFVKYLDGNVRDPQGTVTHPPYPEEWYRRIVEEKGDLLEENRFSTEPEEEE
jgi:dipeptidase